MEMECSAEEKSVTVSSNFGYKVKLCNIKKLDKHKCPLCNRLLRKPIQTEQGEVACQQCYSNTIKDDSICPIDNEPCSGIVYIDKAKEKYVLALICCCTFTTFGCTWQGQVRDLEEHEKI